MALYQDGILISGANTLPKFTLAEYNALPADQRPTYWERLDGDYDDILAEKSDIATVESGTTASRAYSVGELVYVSGTLYRVKTAIASGATFTVGTNVEVANVSLIAKNLNTLTNGVSGLRIATYTRTVGNGTNINFSSLGFSNVLYVSLNVNSNAYRWNVTQQKQSDSSYTFGLSYWDGTTWQDAGGQNCSLLVVGV